MAPAPVHGKDIGPEPPLDRIEGLTAAGAAEAAPLQALVEGDDAELPAAPAHGLLQRSAPVSETQNQA